MKVINRIFFYALLFIFIFLPKFIFLPIDISSIISGICILILLIDSHHKKSIYIAFVHNKTIIFLLLLTFIYLLFIEFIANKNLSSNNYSILCLRTLIECVIPGSVLAFFCLKKQISLFKIISWFILFQFIFTILMLVNISVKDFIFTKILDIRGDSILMFVHNRAYGLARNYISSFAVLIGYFACYLMLEFNKKPSLATMITIIMANVIIMFNARTGFVVELIALFFIEVYNLCHLNKQWKKLCNSFLIFILIIPVGYYILTSKSEQISAAWSWILNGKDSISSLLQGDTSEGIFYAFEYMLFLPEKTIELLFGTANFSFPNSDIGYIRYIFYGGLFFSFLIYLVYILLIKKMIFYSKKQYELYLFSLGIMVTLPFAHFKGDILLLNEVVKFLFFYFFYLYYLSKQEIIQNN
jgi:hypothetical protein